MCKIFKTEDAWVQLQLLEEESGLSPSDPNLCQNVFDFPPPPPGLSTKPKIPFSTSKGHFSPFQRHQKQVVGGKEVSATEAH